jgi:hypothetical protein
MTSKEIRYFIQRSKKEKLLGQACLTMEEAEKTLKLYRGKKFGKYAWHDAIIVKKMVEPPVPLTEEEHKFMEEFSKGINGALREVRRR